MCTQPSISLLIDCLRYNWKALGVQKTKKTPGCMDSDSHQMECWRDAGVTETEYVGRKSQLRNQSYTEWRHTRMIPLLERGGRMIPRLAWAIEPNSSPNTKTGIKKLRGRVALVYSPSTWGVEADNRELKVIFQCIVSWILDFNFPGILETI